MPRGYKEKLGTTHTLILCKDSSKIPVGLLNVSTCVRLPQSDTSDKQYRSIRVNLRTTRYSKIIITELTPALARILDGTDISRTIIYLLHFSGKAYHTIAYHQLSQTLTVDGKSVDNPLSLSSLRTYLNDRFGHSNASCPKQYHIKHLLQVSHTHTPIKLKPLPPTPLLTLAVSAYNVEAYIANAMVSALCHPYAGSIELIIVNDGSSDQTLNVIDRTNLLLKKSGLPQALVITQQNCGPGGAINAAIKAARGLYFKLLDGDDYLHTPALVQLIKRLNVTRSDMLLTNYVEDIEYPAAWQPVLHYQKMQPLRSYPVANKNTLTLLSYAPPLLSTTTCKTSILQASGYLLDEHCYYVDMEYNYMTIKSSATVEYLPINLYIYYLGRKDQSMSISSIKRNWEDHERVCKRLVKDYSDNPQPDIKLDYIRDRIIIPMCESQYMITTSYLRNRKAFMRIDGFLSAYSSFYYSATLTGKLICVHRISRGLTVWLTPVFQALANFAKRHFRWYNDTD